MGFWQGPVGIARIIANGGYAANAVAIGRGSDINTSGESLKVLPSPNACTKGTPFIFTIGAQTASQDCKINTGLNRGTLNTLAAQTLALGYNLKPALLPGFAGQHIGDLGCSVTGTTLSLTDTVDQAFTAAVALIDKTYPLASPAITNGDLGAMNVLLNCINAEA
jgi:hypothetical protein